MSRIQTDTSVCHISQLNPGFLDGTGGANKEETGDGLYLTIVPDRDNVLISLSCRRDQEEEKGTSCFILDKFLRMSQKDLEVSIEMLCGTGVEWTDTEQE